MIPDQLITDLKNLNYKPQYELHESNCKIFIIFNDFPLPPNIYNMSKTDLLIYTVPYYPNAGFDMFWVDKDLTLINGNLPRNAELTQNHCNKTWRRFSYHPYELASWNPSEDDVCRYISYVVKRLSEGD